MNTPEEVVDDARKTAQESLESAIDKGNEPFDVPEGSVSIRKSSAPSTESSNASVNNSVDIGNEPFDVPVNEAALSAGNQREIGIGEKIQKGVEAETGEETSVGRAIAQRMVPGWQKVEKIGANLKTNALEDIIENTALDDFHSISPNDLAKSRAADGLKTADANSLMNTEKELRVKEIMSRSGLDKLPEANTDEFRALTPEAKIDFLRPYAERELYQQTAVKQSAKETLGSTRQGTWGKIVSGGVENTGYTLEYVVASILAGGNPVLATAIAGAASAADRTVELGTNDYYIDKDGNLVNQWNALTPGEAALKGSLGGLGEAAVESGFGAAVGFAGRGAMKLIGNIPGAKNIMGAIAGAAEATKGKIKKIPGVKVLPWLGEQYGKLARITQMQGMPEELAEEDVQAWLDDVVGLNRKNDPTNYGWEEYRRDTFNWKSQQDIILGMLGTMVVQGGIGAAVGAHQQNKVDKAYASLRDERNMPSFTSRNANEARGWLQGHGISAEQTNDLTDNQAAFVANIGRRLIAMTPAEREKLVEAHGEKVAAMAQRLVEQENFEFDQNAIAKGRQPVRFTPKTDARGLPAWDNGVIMGADGKMAPAKFMADPATGIRITDNGTNADGKNSYTVEDQRGNRFDVDSFDMAYHLANRQAKRNFTRNEENKVKAQAVGNIITQMFGNAEQNKFVICNTLGDLLADMRRNGSTDKQIETVRNHVLAQGDGAVAFGNGQVAVILDNVQSPNDAYELLQHETIGHTALANKFGGKENVIKFLRSLDAKTMKDFTAQVIENHKQRHLAAGVDEATANRLATQEVTSDEGIQEVFAHMVQNRRHSPTLGQKLNHFVRGLMGQGGTAETMNDADLEVMLAQMEQEAAATSGSGTGVRVAETMTDENGFTFLKTAPETAETTEAATDAEAAPTEAEAPAAGGADNYRIVNGRVSEGLQRKLGRTPSSSEIDSAITRIIDAPSWDDAMNAIADLGLADDTELFNAAKSFYGENADTTAQPAETGAPTETKTAPAEPKTEKKSETSGVGTKFTSETDFHAKILSKTPAQEVAIDTVTVNNKINPNVKRGADPVTGEVTPIKGDPIDLVSNPIVVWERKDGERVVATGRHRYWLYKRAGRKTIPARIIKEADGWTLEDVLILDAMSNIIDKKGTVHDYFDFFGRIKATREQAAKGNLLNTELGRSAFSLYADAGTDLQGAVNWDEPGEYAEDRIPVETAAMIASILPKDANPYHVGAQRAVVGTILKNPKMRGRKAEILARQLAYESKVKQERGGESGKGGEKYVQDDLFGADDSFMKEMAAIAEYRAKRANDYRYDASVFANTSGKKAKDIALKGGKAAEYGITDADDTKQIKKAYDLAKAKERYWAEGNLTPEDEAQMRKDLNLPPKGGAAVEPEKPTEPEKPKEEPNQGDLFGGEGENKETPKEEKKPKAKKETPKTDGEKPETEQEVPKSDKEPPKTEPKLSPTEEKPPKADKPKEEKKPEAKKETAKPAAEKPKAAPKKTIDIDVGDLAGDIGDAFGAYVPPSFATPGFANAQPTSVDEEKYPKQVAAVTKIVNRVMAKFPDQVNFKTVATIMFEQFNQYWPNIKPALRGIWNGIADKNDYEDVSRKEADALYAELEGRTEEAKEEPKAEPQPTKEEPKTEPQPAPKADAEPPVVTEPPAPPEPRSGKKNGFSPEEAGKIAFDIGGSEADQKEVADLIGDITFASPDFAVALQENTLANGEKAVMPVATAPRELTPEEKEHNRIVIAKLIKKLVSMGHNTFDKLVRSIAHASYKLYNACKKTLRGHWSDAVNNGIVPEDNDVTVKQANEVIAEVDEELADALHIEPTRADGRTQWTIKDQRDAYLAMTNRAFAAKNPEAVKIANEMLEQGVEVSGFARIQDWWTQDDAAYWPVKGLKIINAADAAALFQMLSNPYVEISKALYIDKNHRVLEGRVLGIGTRTQVVNPFGGIDENIPEGTVGIIISHNHPSGNVVPSGPVSGQTGDVQATEYLINLLNQKDLLLLDHIVTDTDHYTSMAAGVAKGVDKVYGNMRFNYNAQEFWHPKIVNRGESIYNYPPLKWENVLRMDYDKTGERLESGYFNGSTDSVAQFVADQLSTHNQDRSMIVMLNDDSKIVGIVRIPTAEALKKNQKLSDAVSDIIKNHKEMATAMIYFGHEKFDAKEIADAFMKNSIRIAAIYSADKGKFIGEKSDTPENHKFKKPHAMFKLGYEEALLAGSHPSIWDNNAKGVSRRVPKALPVEILPKIQYTITQKGGKNGSVDESREDRADAGTGDGGVGTDVGPSSGKGGQAGGPNDRTGQDNSGRGVQDAGEGSGSGVGGAQSDGADGQRGVGQDGGKGQAGAGLHPDGQRGRNGGNDDDQTNGSARDSVHLQPGTPDTQTVTDNFIATEKVIEAWDRVGDLTPKVLVERAKANIEALDVLDSLLWNDEANSDDENILPKVNNNSVGVRLGAPQRTPTMAEKEALASYTGWYGFKDFIGNGNLEAAYNQYLALTEELRNAGIEIDTEATLAKAAERTNNLRHIADTENAVKTDDLDAFKELKEMMSEDMLDKISYGAHEVAWNARSNGAENAPAMPTELATALLDTISNAGLKGGYFINPLAGWSREVALAGSRFARDVNWTLFEPNDVKAKILRALFPKANVFNGLYRNTVSVNDFYDMAITVAPKDDNAANAQTHKAEDVVKGASRSQNDIIKLVRQLRVGGVAAVVMTEGTKETLEKTARMVGMEGGRVVGFIRMPASLAGYDSREYYSGNERGADDNQAIVMLVQREGSRTLNKNAVAEDRKLGINGVPAQNNVGFAITKDTIKMPIGMGSYDVANVEGYSADYENNPKAVYDQLRDVLKSVMASANANALSDPNASRFMRNADAAVREANGGHPEGETWLDGDTLKIKEMGKEKRVWISSEHGNEAKDNSKFSVSEITGLSNDKVISVMKSYDVLRKAIDAALDADCRNLADAADKKKAMQDAYNAFVSKHGIVHNEENLKVIGIDRFNLGRVDGIIQYNEKSGVEKFIEFETDNGNASIVEINPFLKVDSHDVPKDGADAVRMSITNKGFIDPTYIGKILGIPAREAMQKLVDERVVFVDPQSQRYVDRSEYLSGLVRSKYEAAKKASSIDSRFIGNAEELQKKLTPMTSFDAGNVNDRPQVSARCGWIPIDIMRTFFRKMCGIHGLEKIDYNRTAGRWIYLDDWKKVTIDNPAILRIGDTNQKHRHIKCWLDGRPAIITDENGQIDDEASEDVNNAFAELDKQLADFIVGNREYKTRVEKAFSEQLQDEFVERDYSDYAISLPGISTMWWNRVTPAERFYQRRAIAGAFIGDTQLLDHNVGSGKTFEMIASVMAMKHFGKIRKPVMTLTNTTVKAIHDDWLQMFPNARLLVLKTHDLSKNSRVTEDLIKNNDWDGILMSEETFKEFGMSLDFINGIIEDVSVDYDAELAALKDAYGNVRNPEERGNGRRTTAEKDYDEQVAEVIKAKDNALKQYEEMKKDAEGNRALCFDKLGIDYLVVDEAHYFKKVSAKTSKGKISGVDAKSENSGLTKAMVPACYYLNKLHGGRHGVLFATGTPLTNSFTEVYTMMNYLAPGLLRDIGCPTLDSFLNAFCNFKVEFSPEIGGGYKAETVLQVANAFPLSKLFRHVTDVALAGQDYNVQGLPERRDYIVEIPQSDVQQMSTDAIAELAQRLDNGEKIPGVTRGYLRNSFGRNVAISPHIIGIRDAQNTRARVQARIIKSFYDKNPNMHHVIFTDAGAPKEFKYKNMVVTGNDSFQLIGKGGRLIDVGPRNPHTGYRNIKATIQYNENLVIGNKEESIGWSYLDEIPGQDTGDAPFNPAALHMALAVLERKADVVLGKIKSISKTKKGESVSKGDIKKKAKLTSEKKFDFESALNSQIKKLGYDPRLTDVTDKSQFMIPPLVNKNLIRILVENGEAALDNELRKTPMFQFYWGHTFEEYSKIIEELVAAGIKPEEIVIAHTQEQIEAIRQDFDSINGKKKVLITGKTAQEGVNFQHALWTLHHHDIPWMPGPMGQRNGRIWRPGNPNSPVHIFNYITPDTMDGRSYTIVSRKAKLLHQIQTRPEHNLIEDVGDDAGSLAEMTTFAIKDKRVYWKDRLEKQLRRNRATVDGEEKRLVEFNKNIKNFTNQQGRQNEIVEEARRELMPIFEKREAAKREFVIVSTKGDKLTTTKEILEYLSDAARKANPPVRRTAEEFTIGDYLTALEFSDENNEKDIESVNDFLANEGITAESGLDEYYKAVDLVYRMHVENFLDSESTGETVVGDFYGTPVKIVTRFSNNAGENGGRKTLYSAEIETCNASMAMPVNPVMRDGRPDGEAPTGSEQGLAQMKGSVTKTLNPVSDARPVPKMVANAEDMLMDINERLASATTGKANAEKSLKEAQGPIDSLERKLQMLHDSFMADSNGTAQPADDFKENLESYMKDGDTEDEESMLYKVNGGGVLNDGRYDEKIHTTAPKRKADNGKPTPPTPTTAPKTQTEESDSPSFATPDFTTAPRDWGKEQRGITNAEQNEAMADRNLKAPQKRVRGDERVLQEAEALESNDAFMATLRHVLARNPRVISAEENVAMARSWLRAKDEYDDLVQSHVEAINAGDEEAAKQIAKQKAIKEKELSEYVKAREAGVGEAARTLRTNRFLFARDYSLAGLAAQRISDLGRPLTDVEYKELKEIADKLKKLDEADRDIALARIKAQAERVIQDLINAAKVDAATTPRTDNEMRRMLRKRNEALAQIEVLAYELGGEIGALIPDKDGEDFVAGSQLSKMRKYLRDLAKYHVYHNPNITELELVQQFIDDIAPYFTATIHDIRQVFSEYGHSWKINRNEIDRKVSDLTSQSRILEQILSLDNGEIPKLTGPQRGDDSDIVRELKRIRDQKRRQMERDGILPTGENHLKTMLETSKTRYRHMIEDIKAALDAHVKLPQRASNGVTDAELDALKEEYETLRKEYDAIWGRPEMSEETKRKMVTKSLERAMERWTKKLDDARNGRWTPPGKTGPKVTGGAIDILREKIKTAAMEVQNLRKNRTVSDISPEELKFIAQNRRDAIVRAIQHWQTASITGDIAPKKAFSTREFVKDMERRVNEEKDPARRAELEKTLAELREGLRQEEANREIRNAVYRQILDMREHDKNRKTPLGLGYAKEYAAFVNNMMRSLLATADFSAMMRQTSALTTAHLPTALKTFWKTFGTMLPSGSRKAQDIDRELRSDPIVREAIENGWLNWRNLEGDGGSGDVEMFNGVDAQAITIGKRKDGTERRVALGDIPMLSTVLHGSERQYASFINMMSADIYRKLVNSPVWGRNGASDYQKRELAAYVNMANGSAQLGTKGKQAMSMLTKVFWAPKLAVSRLQLAVGAGIIHPFVAGESADATMKERGKVASFIALEHARSFAGAIAAGFLLMCLFGDDDDKYEMSQAQGVMDKALLAIKPRIGSTSIDFSGGVSQWWKLMRMLYTGTKKTATGREIDLRNTYGRSLTQEIFRFAQGKLNPLASNALALVEGKDYVGNEFGLGQLVQNTFLPLGGQDVVGAIANENNGPWRGLLMAPLILTGAGGSTYDVDRFRVAQNTFNARVAEYRNAMRTGNYARISELTIQFPELKQMGRVQALFDAAQKTEANIKKRQKKGLPESQPLNEMLQRQRQMALDAFRSVRTA